MTEHDIPLSAIITPSEIVEMRLRFPRPKGLYWELLPEEKIADIPVLEARKKRMS
jgi:5-formyltetrahydrofolate cyclo-ligase